MSRWTTVILVLLLLIVLVPLMNELCSISPAFTTDNLLQGKLVSRFNP
ncbi:MAG: hypothetical protein ACM3O9_09185 [Methylocystaceae bacterium]